MEESHFKEELADVFPLVSLQLDDLTVLRVLNHSPIACKFLPNNQRPHIEQYPYANITGNTKLTSLSVCVAKYPNMIAWVWWKEERMLNHHVQVLAKLQTNKKPALSPFWRLSQASSCRSLLQSLVLWSGSCVRFVAVSLCGFYPQSRQGEGRHPWLHQQRDLSVWKAKTIL